MRESTRLFSEWRFHEALVTALREGQGSEEILAASLCRLGLPYRIGDIVSPTVLESEELLVERAWSEFEAERLEEANRLISKLPASSPQRRAFESTMYRVEFPVHVSGEEDADELVWLLAGLWASGRDLEAREAIDLYRKRNPDDVRSPLLAMRLVLARGERSRLGETDVSKVMEQRHPEALYLLSRIEARHGSPQEAEEILKRLSASYPLDFRPSFALYQLRRGHSPKLWASLPLLKSVRIVSRIGSLQRAALPTV
ncbi:hypothetical protein EON81_19080 [bacterium]|nr:MAG: hypothetical protein EON81_19080 [bacterium]